MTPTEGDSSPAVPCPRCGEPLAADAKFCEACGADNPLASAEAAPAAAVPAPAAPAAPAAPEPTVAPVPGGSLHDGTLLDDLTAAATDRARHPAPAAEVIRIADADLTLTAAVCAACGGRVAADGYCEQCGTAAPRLRDHWRDQPAAWLAAVCDRGVRHTRNEDAMAVAAGLVPGSLGALVVCDGVSMATDSDRASLAAARAARDALVDGLTARPDDAQPQGRTGARIARAGEFTQRLIAAGAAAQAQAAAAAAGVPSSKNPPSCTFVAALIERSPGDAPGLAVVGWVGDSRAYWVPDDGPAVQLSVDDSWAAEAMAQGVPRAEAENLPQSHAITRWLGADAPDPVPRTAVHALDGPGWLLVCSDGLWNYASEASALGELVHTTIAARTAAPAPPAADAADPADDAGSAEAPDAGSADPGADKAPADAVVKAPADDPAQLAEELVAWAIERGGHDNITVALARHDPNAPTEVVPAPAPLYPLVDRSAPADDPAPDDAAPAVGPAATLAEPAQVAPPAWGTPDAGTL